jgi:DNA-binding NtrC family response regulator
MSFFGAEKGAYTGATQARSGYFSDAQNGTLFIDEVQNLSWSNQAKLLRVLESRSYQRLGSSQNLSFKGRIIFATNIHLHQKVQEGHFREDLYYRISQVKLHVPPLRLRREDIPQLANSFLKSELKNPLRFTDKALLYLQDSYDWPGNVRELRGLIKDLAYKHPLPLIDALDIEQALNGKWASWTEEAKNKASPESFQINWQEDFDTNIKTLEKYLLKIGLDKWGSRETREKFKISRSRFYDKLKEYKLISD